MTLLILAAGMGSRYGGLKQLDPMTEHGEFIIDFSVYDAVKAGFDKVVFIIKKENYDAFRQTIGARVEKKIRTAYVFQDIGDLPGGYAVPDGRVKPWGTTHAVLCAAKEIGNDPFAVINADDFYGRDAFVKLAAHLGSVKKDEPSFCMIGYVASNTLSDNGTVSRGICRMDDARMLTSIVERTGMKKDGGEGVCDDGEGGVIRFPLDTLVSMNCWGFTQKVFRGLESSFLRFLEEVKTLDGEKQMKKECYLPNTVQELISAGDCTVRVYPTNAVWYGVTYHEDKEYVKSSIRSLIERGEYPDGLWD
ncbi:MAG: NTP transferase domain-containing protein [Clostridia bacterium]|nr:NTP transferase domain-containing protein [Clostridia bacterium]